MKDGQQLIMVLMKKDYKEYLEYNRFILMARDKLIKMINALKVIKKLEQEHILVLIQKFVVEDIVQLYKLRMLIKMSKQCFKLG